MADLPAPASDQAEPLVEASTDAATGLGPQPSEASATAAANIEEATMITAMADTALRGPESDTSSRQGITLPGEEVGGQERAAAADNGSESDAELVEHKYDIAIEEAAAREQADQANKFADLFRDQLQQVGANSAPSVPTAGLRLKTPENLCFPPAAGIGYVPGLRGPLRLAEPHGERALFRPSDRAPGHRRQAA